MIINSLFRIEFTALNHEIEPYVIARDTGYEVVKINGLYIASLNLVPTTVVGAVVLALPEEYCNKNNIIFSSGMCTINNVVYPCVLLAGAYGIQGYYSSNGQAYTDIPANALIYGQITWRA